jgi:predicted TIM-barrel enzyme
MPSGYHVGLHGELRPGSSGTGRGVDRRDLETVLAAVIVPVRGAHGVVVGSCLRASGRAGDPVDPEAARRFAEAFRASRA